MLRLCPKLAPQLDLPGCLWFSACAVPAGESACESGSWLNHVIGHKQSKVHAPEAQSPLRSTMEHVNHRATGQQVCPVESTGAGAHHVLFQCHIAALSRVFCMLYMLHRAIAQAASACAHAAITCFLRMQDIVVLARGSHHMMYVVRCTPERRLQRGECARPACPMCLAACLLQAHSERAQALPRWPCCICVRLRCRDVCIACAGGRCAHKTANSRLQEVRCRLRCSRNNRFPCMVLACQAISRSALE